MGDSSTPQSSLPPTDEQVPEQFPPTTNTMLTSTSLPPGQELLHSHLDLTSLSHSPQATADGTAVRESRSHTHDDQD